MKRQDVSFLYFTNDSAYGIVDKFSNAIILSEALGHTVQLELIRTAERGTPYCIQAFTMIEEPHDRQVICNNCGDIREPISKWINGRCAACGKGRYVPAALAD